MPGSTPLQDELIGLRPTMSWRLVFAECRTRSKVVIVRMVRRESLPNSTMGCLLVNG